MFTDNSCADCTGSTFAASITQDCIAYTVCGKTAIGGVVSRKIGAGSVTTDTVCGNLEITDNLEITSDTTGVSSTVAITTGGSGSNALALFGIVTGGYSAIGGIAATAEDLIVKQQITSLRNTPNDGFFIGLWLNQNGGTLAKNSLFDGTYSYFASDGFVYGSTTQNWKVMAKWSKENRNLYEPFKNEMKANVFWLDVYVQETKI